MSTILKAYLQNTQFEVGRHRLHFARRLLEDQRSPREPPLMRVCTKFNAAARNFATSNANAISDTPLLFGPFDTANTSSQTWHLPQPVFAPTTIYNAAQASRLAIRGATWCNILRLMQKWRKYWQKRKFIVRQCLRRSVVLIKKNHLSI